MKRFLMLVAIAMLGLCALTGCHKSKLEKKSRPLVDKIASEVLDSGAKCKKVKVTEKIDEKNYNAVAEMDDGKEIEILIEDCGDSVQVAIAYLAKLEKAARPLVDQIISTNVGDNGAKCEKVKIKKKISDKVYKGVASLDNGNDVTVEIVDDGDTIYVQYNPLQ